MANNREDKGASKVNYGLGTSSALYIDDFAITNRTSQVLKYLSLHGKTLLDIGCGNGLYTVRFAEGTRRTIGLDIADEPLNEARRNRGHLKTGVEFVKASAESLPFSDRTFDVALAIELLEHIENQDSVLKEASRILKDGGYLVIYVPNKLYPFETHGFRLGRRTLHGFHGSVPFLSWCPQLLRKKFERARIYCEKEIISLVERNGFTVREVDYMYPPLDRLGREWAKAFLRQFLHALDSHRFLKRFGMSILVLAQKVVPV